MANNYTHLLGVAKSTKQIVLRSRRNLTATLCAPDGSVHVIPHAIIFAFIDWQIKNDYNSINWWPIRLKKIIVEYYYPYYRSGGTISAISGSSGIWPVTIKSWFDDEELVNES